jgi:transposase-like protein
MDEAGGGKKQVIYEVGAKGEEKDRSIKRGEKPKVERSGIEDKRGRKGSRHRVEEKCRAVLSVRTKRRKRGEVCRELGVTWNLLSQRQDQAMKGMLLALQPRVSEDNGVTLNPRLAVLLERRSKGGEMKGVERRSPRILGGLSG